MKYASHESRHQWFALNNSRNLVVRKYYERIWTIILGTYSNRKLHLSNNLGTEYERILIIGNPGIGKTVSMNYYIIMALKENIPVVIETRSKRYFIDAGSNDVYHEPIESTNLIPCLDNYSVLLFHDNQPNEGPRFSIYCCSCVS